MSDPEISLSVFWDTARHIQPELSRPDLWWTWQIFRKWKINQSLLPAGLQHFYFLLSNKFVRTWPWHSTMLMTSISEGRIMHTHNKSFDKFIELASMSRELTFSNLPTTMIVKWKPFLITFLCIWSGKVAKPIHSSSFCKHKTIRNICAQVQKFTSAAVHRKCIHAVLQMTLQDCVELETLSIPYYWSIRQLCAKRCSARQHKNTVLCHA